MNIFVTSECPWESAKVLPDKHIVKMPLETCQMLSIVCSDKWGHGFGTIPKADGTPYSTEKGAFRNHPCTIWASEFVMNWQWLLHHGIALCDEYKMRYGKTHTCFHSLLAAKEILPTGDPTGRSGTHTPFVRAMPEEFKCDNAVESYRRYYIGAKQEFAEWRNGTPEWFIKQKEIV